AVEDDLEGEVLVGRLPRGRAQPRRQLQRRARRGDLLRGVRERHVPQVVAEHRQPHRRPEARARRVRQVRGRRHRVEHAGGDVHGAQRVRVPGVRGARERHVPEAQLPHAAQPLVEAGVDDRALLVADGDGPVDRVSYPHSPRLSPRSAPAAKSVPLKRFVLGMGDQPPMHIALLHNLDHDLLEDDPGREARKDVAKVAQALASALDGSGARAQLVPVTGAADLLSSLEGLRPDLVINLCESLAADSRGEMAIPLLLDLLHIPYTGSAALSLGLALHKHKAKEVLFARGVPTPAFALVERMDDLAGLDLPFPLIVKPDREDASAGVDFDSVVHTRAQLERACRAVLTRFHQPALVEQYVDGPEVNVPLLGNRGGGRAHLPLTEIRFGAAFAARPRILSYRAKWEADSAECKDSPSVPCTLGAREQERLRAVATAAFDALECRDYGRVDLRLGADD